MKKLSKLKLQSLNQSQFDSLTSKQMATLNGGTTYGSCNTVTSTPSGGKDDGADEVD